jgi:hypothetical protein
MGEEETDEREVVLHRLHLLAPVRRLGLGLARFDTGNGEGGEFQLVTKVDGEYGTYFLRQSMYLKPRLQDSLVGRTSTLALLTARVKQVVQVPSPNTPIAVFKSMDLLNSPSRLQALANPAE